MVFGALHLMTLIFTVHLKVWPLGKKPHVSAICQMQLMEKVQYLLLPTGYGHATKVPTYLCTKYPLLVIRLACQK